MSKSCGTLFDSVTILTSVAKCGAIDLHMRKVALVSTINTAILLKLVCLRKIVDFRDDIWRCKTLHRDDKILCNKKT